MELYCQVTPQGLVPLYDSDLDAKHKLKEGKVYKVTVTTPRNYQFLKKFFALIRLTLDNLPERLQDHYGIYNETDMLNCIKLDLGLAHTITYNDHPVLITESISFAAMDEAEFEQFYNRTIDLILQHYLRGTDRETLLEEVQQFR